jgi:hypothetical protein
MDIYCTSKNYGPSLGLPDQVAMVYLGTSREEAYKAVGDFLRYELTRTETDRKGITTYVAQFYTALPRDIVPEFVAYFMTDVWWYTIVKFELNSPPVSMEVSQVEKLNRKIKNLIFSNMGEVTQVMTAIAHIVARYHVITLADLHDLVGTPNNYHDERWGWRRLDSVMVHHTSRGYEMEFPPMEEI